MAPYRTYVMGFAIKRGALPDALYWDTEDPYHYVRLQRGDRAKRISSWSAARTTKAAKPTMPRNAFSAWKQWARGKMPMLKEVTHRWSGQVLDTIDYAGFIGKNPGSEHIYVATGDSGQGLTHGVMGAMLNTTLITGGRARGPSFMRRAACRLKPQRTGSRKTAPPSRISRNI